MIAWLSYICIRVVPSSSNAMCTVRNWGSRRSARPIHWYSIHFVCIWRLSSNTPGRGTTRRKQHDEEIKPSFGTTQLHSEVILFFKKTSWAANSPLSKQLPRVETLWAPNAPQWLWATMVTPRLSLHVVSLRTLVSRIHALPSLLAPCPQRLYLSDRLPSAVMPRRPCMSLAGVPPCNPTRVTS